MSKLFPRFGAAIDDHNFISRDNQTSTALMSTNFPQLTVFRDAQNFHRSDRSGKIKKNHRWLVFVCCQGCPSFLRNSHAFQGCAKFHCMVLEEFPKFRRGILAEFRVSKVLWQFLARRQVGRSIQNFPAMDQGCPRFNRIFPVDFRGVQKFPVMDQGCPRFRRIFPVNFRYDQNKLQNYSS